MLSKNNSSFFASKISTDEKLLVCGGSDKILYVYHIDPTMDSDFSY